MGGEREKGGMRRGRDEEGEGLDVRSGIRRLV